MDVQHHSQPFVFVANGGKISASVPIRHHVYSTGSPRGISSCGRRFTAANGWVIYVLKHGAYHFSPGPSQADVLSVSEGTRHGKLSSVVNVPDVLGHTGRDWHVLLSYNFYAVL